MKDLRNISGILPAQCRSNPNDCGISWSEHRKVERVKSEDVIQFGAPLLHDALTEYLKETMAACMRSLSNIHVDPAEKGVDQTAVDALGVKPIDPATINVGDTVRLVGSRTIKRWPNHHLEVGKDYKVIHVDRNCDFGMAVSVPCNSNVNYLWIYDEDLMLVESA